MPARPLALVLLGLAACTSSRTARPGEPLIVLPSTGFDRGGLNVVAERWAEELAALPLFPAGAYPLPLVVVDEPFETLGDFEETYLADMLQLGLARTERFVLVDTAIRRELVDEVEGGEGVRAQYLVTSRLEARDPASIGGPGEYEMRVELKKVAPDAVVWSGAKTIRVER